MAADSSSKAYEKTAQRRRKAELHLELYVSGTTPQSVRAIRNLKNLCEEYSQIKIKVKIIDVYKNPSQARKAQVFAVPTLIKVNPQPVKRLIGDLSDTGRVLKGLGLRM